MLTKQQQQMLTEEQVAAYCTQISKYSKEGYRVIVSKDEKRTNSLSLEDGGAIVFTVDHGMKVEVAYPNVKKPYNYAMKIKEKFDPKKSHIKKLDEIYSTNHRDNQENIIYKDGVLY